MAKAKQNNLTLSKVKSVSKSLDKTRVHIIESGHYVGEQITFHPIFNDKTIEELLTEFGKMLNEAEEKSIDLSQNMQIYLIYMLTIKHFTHFKKDIPSTLLSQDKNAGMIDILEHFHKTGLLLECLDKMFLPSETTKVLNKMTDFAAMGLLSMDLDKKMIEKFEQLKSKNENMFERLKNFNTENEIVE
jgi:hypothetical protein